MSHGDLKLSRQANDVFKSFNYGYGTSLRNPSQASVGKDTGDRFAYVQWQCALCLYQLSEPAALPDILGDVVSAAVVNPAEPQEQCWTQR